MSHRRRPDLPPSRTTDRTPNPKLGRGEEGDRKGKISSSWSSRGIASAFFSSERRVWGLSLAFRATNSLLVQTYFNPDEHWQSLEVAHRIVFGYGHLTWEWKRGIRSYLHPLVFALLYKIMAFLRLDTPWFMVKAPRLLQSLFSSFGDLYMYKLSKLLFDEHVARWAFFCQLVNWFMFFCITRTLSNSLETVLTIMGLYYWLSASCSLEDVSTASRKLALFIAALACAIRPTSAITWFYVGMLDLVGLQSRLGFLFLEGFSAMLLTFLPFSIYGIFKSKKWRLSGLIAWVLGVYSMLGHKEFRFVLPVLPIALMFAGYSLAVMSKPDFPDPKRRNKYCNRWPLRVHLAVLFLIMSNVPMALYMSIVHQRGSEDVMFYLSKEAHDGKVKSILFLMPCHSTPYYSTLHHNLPMRFLDCTPSDGKEIPDESDRFLMDPAGFATDMFGNSSSPSHIVLFSSEEGSLREFLISHSFREVRRFFHAHFKVDRDLQASVTVYALADLAVT
ncbi:GPI mannosyltransferase 3 isoform X2 [Phoenix dactylifera]|uniref:Mannosyltransferase n=1 Tax=Phoenix dactylifera TaxID=42345 RepID=A0A8B8ZA56_PHODC|nr:GPI mannosyltransferase 3 isoform X2 [Phoenix dactylifera]